jgi:RNA polymerase-binding transcription factor DksA
MNKKELAEKLEKEKKTLEAQLQTFAKKDTRLKGDWDTKFPKFDGEFGGSALETAADEVEEYASRLPVEYSLELRLKDIDLALEKIKKGKYGRCEKCGKKIDGKRLEIYPAARFCMKCQK